MKAIMITIATLLFVLTAFDCYHLIDWFQSDYFEPTFVGISGRIIWISTTTLLGVFFLLLWQKQS